MSGTTNKYNSMVRPYFYGDFDDNNYRNLLLEYFLANLPENFLTDNSKKDIITDAYNFAYDAHKGQRRQGGYQEPYITHPVEVAIICAKEMGLGTLSVVVALLHDVVEDTNVTVEEIENKFGIKTKILVAGVTKIKHRSQEPGNSQVDSLVNLLKTFKIDSRVLFIKIADRLHNMRTMDDMPDSSRQIKTGENLYIYAPLALLSGMYLVRNELQDLSFRYRYKEIYDILLKELTNSEKEQNEKFERLKNELTDILKTVKLEKFRIIIVKKSLFSLWQKMQKYNLSFKEIHNFYSLKIIIDTDLRDEIEIRNLCFKYFVSLTSKLKYNQSTIRDWLANPKNNGFSAFVFDAFSKQGELFEIQIATEEKHQIAEKGFANRSIKYSTAFDKLYDVINIKEDSDTNVFDLVARIQKSFITQFIKVYTPKRKEIELPKDATVLDFAFHVHSELGFKCIGAKISGKPVLPTHKLSPEDTIEILTSSTAKPDEKWQYIVITNRAREELSKFFKKNFALENANLTTDIQIKNKEPLVVDENLLYLRPKCCNPLPGDDCIAYQDDKNYIEIHKRNCEQAIKFTAVDGKRTTNVIWRPVKQFDAILKGIEISGTDRKGIIKDIVNIVTEELSVNMQAMDIASNNGEFKGKIHLYVYNNSFLINMINKLAKIDNVNNVSTIE